jgi:hypothetical protein
VLRFFEQLLAPLAMAAVLLLARPAALLASVVQTTNAVWYIMVYGSSAIFLLARADFRIALPILMWFACYAALLRTVVPRMRARSQHMSEVRSNLTGRVSISTVATALPLAWQISNMSG